MADDNKATQIENTEKITAKELAEMVKQLASEEYYIYIADPNEI